MFTGIIEETGQLASRDANRFTFSAATVLDGSDIDDSIAVNGVCLTVVARTDETWTADVVEETLSKTTLGRLTTGDKVNLERPVRLIDRLSGHVVQGHVDGPGQVVEAGANMRIRLPERLVPFVVDKGSVTIDGVSLTVVDALDDGFTVALIPHTLEVTTLGDRKPGDIVNIEVDPLGRYVERMMRFAFEND